MACSSIFQPGPLRRDTWSMWPTARAVRQYAAALREVDLSPVRGKRVLLKPNAGRVAGPGSGIVTHPEVVAAAIDAFREAGAEVAVGESPIVGVRMQEAFESSGHGGGRRRARLPAPRHGSPPVRRGAGARRAGAPHAPVCPDVLEFDFVVSVPVMKMHMHTGVTLAVKNMKGCLWRRSKVELHMLPPVAGSADKPLDIAIADMASVLRPHLAIIDGTVGHGRARAQRRPAQAAGRRGGQRRRLCRRCGGLPIDGDRRGTRPAPAAGRRTRVRRDRSGTLTVTPDNWREWVSPFPRRRRI